MENSWDGIVKGDYEKINENELYFETIPISKIVLLCILTCGIYEIVWFYKIWKRLNEKFGYKNTPILRAIFAVITSFWLFPVLSRYIKKFNIKSFNAVLFAILYLALSVFLSWLLSLSTFIIIAIIQNKINKVNEQNFSEAPVNKWCKANTFWSIIGGIFLCLIIFGYFLPDGEQPKPQLDPQQIQQQIEQMKEYSFKYVSVLSPKPFEKEDNKVAEKKDDGMNREMYLAGNDYNDVAVFIEETTHNKEGIDSRKVLYTFIRNISSRADANKAMETAEVTKIGDIEQISYEHEEEEFKDKIKVFAKDDLYIIVSVSFYKGRPDLEPIASKISESVKLLI